MNITFTIEYISIKATVCELCLGRSRGTVVNLYTLKTYLSWVQTLHGPYPSYLGLSFLQ